MNIETDFKDAVGITTTIPLEVPLAAGVRVIDLNNLFVGRDCPMRAIEQAEANGFPRNICAWIKGLYGSVKSANIKKVIGVAEGDCSLTHSLMEVLATEGVDVIPFGFPYSHTRPELDGRIAELEKYFGVTRIQSEEMRIALQVVRDKLHELDALMAKGLPVELTERANILLLSSSDLAGLGLDNYESMLDEFMAEAKSSKSATGVRIALVGIPPIAGDFIERIYSAGGVVVLSEIPREFAMIKSSEDLLEQYLNYTYPYSTEFRLQTLLPLLKERKVDGVLHYVQSFCHRGVEDRLLRDQIDIPMLTLECDRPGPLDERSFVRLEAFIEMLSDSKGME